MKQLHSPFVFQHDSYFFLHTNLSSSEQLFSQDCGMWDVELVRCFRDWGFE